ncbi:MAG: hypothetical protein M0015_12805 [Betaproteobacteria bacterium]|nr:hypothetical protein [Betaproteobacteria bacterium]
MATLVYHFEFPSGRKESLRIDPSAPAGQGAGLPAWTELGFQQCANCPLSPADAPRCPMAVNFVPLVELFGRLRSYEDVTAQVESEERIVIKRTTVQRALRSLMGLLAASSACPHVDFLKPMAHFHLPFSSEEETIYRVASSYLLAQYFRRQQGKDADWRLDGLKAHYQALQQVNAAMARRMRSIEIDDSAVNALVLLDLFAQTLPFSIESALEELQPAFEKYRI